MLLLFRVRHCTHHHLRLYSHNNHSRHAQPTAPMQSSNTTSTEIAKVPPPSFAAPSPLCMLTPVQLLEENERLRVRLNM
jgi:hypothetical protein